MTAVWEQDVDCLVGNPINLLQSVPVRCCCGNRALLVLLLGGETRDDQSFANSPAKVFCVCVGDGKRRQAEPFASHRHDWKVIARFGFPDRPKVLLGNINIGEIATPNGRKKALLDVDFSKERCR